MTWERWDFIWRSVFCGFVLIAMVAQGVADFGRRNETRMEQCYRLYEPMDPGYCDELRRAIIQRWGSVK